MYHDFAGSIQRNISSRSIMEDYIKVEKIGEGKSVINDSQIINDTILIYYYTNGQHVL